MLGPAFTALLDFLAWLRGRGPEKVKSLNEGELFVRYEKASEAQTEKAEAAKTNAPVEHKAS